MPSTSIKPSSSVRCFFKSSTPIFSPNSLPVSLTCFFAFFQMPCTFFTKVSGFAVLLFCAIVGNPIARKANISTMNRFFFINFSNLIVHKSRTKRPNYKIISVYLRLLCCAFHPPSGLLLFANVIIKKTNVQINLWRHLLTLLT